MIHYTGTEFLEGFFTVYSKDLLDVAGVYSAEPPPVEIANPSGGTQTQIPGIGLAVVPVVPQTVSVPFGKWPGVSAGVYYEYTAKFVCGNSYE
jgi:hypothetical protein